MSQSRPGKKIYVDHIVYRLLSYPKTILFGNQFYYQTAKKKFYQNITLLPSKNQSRRFFAWVAYCFLNPIAYSIKKISDLSQSKQAIKTKIILQQTTQNTTKFYLTHIGYQNKDARKKTVSELLRTFDQSEDTIDYRYAMLCKKIKRPSDWEKPENMAEFNDIYTQAAFHFSYFLIATEKLLSESPTSKEKVNEVTDQRIRDPKQRLIFRLSCSNLLFLYHTANTFMLRSEKDHEMDARLRKANQHFHDKSRYPKQYAWRQAYNTNMKLFASIVGISKNDRATLENANEHIEKWTRIDSRKKDAPIPFIPQGGVKPTGPRR